MRGEKNKELKINGKMIKKFVATVKRGVEDVKLQNKNISTTKCSC
jgi:hypothetical protein